MPRHAVTMGVATILEAREIVLLATGEHKAGILRRAVEGEVDHAVAATFLQRHPAVTIYADHAAAAELTRVATPWLLDEVRWTPELEVKAVVWLSLTAGKAILKLTEHDYTEHHLGPLLARHGEPGAVNGQIFNALGSRIRGRSKLPREKTVICFSPHPDDDVISAGGILRKLQLNGNRIVVGYCTSGNIAVFDHDVRRYVEVLERLAADEHLARRKVDSLDGPGSCLPRGEARGRDRHRGGARPQADHPRGRGGERNRDIGDPACGGALPRPAVLPDRQGEEGSDRPGRYRDRACAARRGASRPGAGRWRSLRSARHPPALQGRDRRGARRGVPARHAGPEVWLYRGAWQEWPVTEATWLVPLAQEELRLKIQAIFKHQSQKDSAPFPGQDDREFWQRVESRNKETAALLDRLGLAEYFAMEAYVVAS